MSNLPIARAGVLIVLLTGASHLSALPDYLDGREPTSATLEDKTSATERIGQDANAAFDWEQIRPSRYLHLWREQLIPETRNPFVDDMQFSLRPRFYYFHRKLDPGSTMETAAAGGSLSVESGWWRDRIRLGMTGYGSWKMHGPRSRDGLGLLREGQKDYTSLGEAYLDVKFDQTRFRTGRSRVDLPFINDDDIRMTPNTFEGVGVTSSVIPNLKIGMAHIAGIKRRTGGNFHSLSEHAGVSGPDRGVTAVSARYDFGENSFVAFTEQHGWDMTNTLYVEASHLVEIGDDLKLHLGAQFTDQRSVGDELLGSFTTHQAGLELALEYLGVLGTLSFVWTDAGGGIVNPWGGTPTYHSMMISDFDKAGEDSVRLGLSYDLERLGLDGVTANTSWVYGDTPDRGENSAPDEEEFNVTVDYQPSIEAVSDFWLRVRWAHNDKKSGADSFDTTDFRVLLNYSYLF